MIKGAPGEYVRAYRLSLYRALCLLLISNAPIEYDQRVKWIEHRIVATLFAKLMAVSLAKEIALPLLRSCASSISRDLSRCKEGALFTAHTLTLSDLSIDSKRSNVTRHVPPRVLFTFTRDMSCVVFSPRPKRVLPLLSFPSSTFSSHTNAFEREKRLRDFWISQVVTSNNL